MALDWRPFFLRPDTPPEGRLLEERYRAMHRDPNNPLKRRADALGLTMNFRDVIPSTRRAHEASEFARTRGRHEPMNAALLRKYWSEGQDLWSLDVLRSAAVEAGLDADELQQAIEAGTHREAVEQAVREAQQMGIHAVPTFLFDERMALQGAHEVATLRKVMERLGRTPRGG